MTPVVLVVDQDPDSCELYCTYLAYEGFTCKSASDGATALRMIAELVPDVVLLEAVLPQVSGWDVALRVKQNPLLRAVRIVMVTSEAFPEHRQRAADVGADGFLPKPAAPQDVVYIVRALLAVRGQAPDETVQ